ncbi:MAG TPA: hypothetical protein VGB77_15790 [Abditibacteriaceae bacterium]|jgi:hypothetical protein
MLTLDQVRAVNDGLKSGDIHAALRPLEESIDLRHAELPKLEKSALAALKTGLQTPEIAQIWAEAAFHPNVSVRRFVRKTLLGLKRDAAPVAGSIQKQLEQFWAQETPLAESTKPREAALRREQIEIVQSAVEILLRADPETFIQFYGAILDSLPPEEDRTKQWQEWINKQQEYSKAVQAKNEALTREEWGEDYLPLGTLRNHLPWRIVREISERVQNDPEVQKLLADLGASPWQNAAAQWNPTGYFQGAMNQVMLPDATGPQKEIAGVLRPHLWNWLEGGFDETLEPEAKRRALVRAFSALPSYWQWQQLEREEFWKRVPPLLKRTREALLPEIQKALNENNYHSKTIGSLWVQVLNSLVSSCRKPYNVKEEEWHVPEHITPELLRELKVESKAPYFSDQLEEVAKQLEKSRQKAEAVVAPEPEPVVLRTPAGTEISDLMLYFPWEQFHKEREELGLGADGYQTYVQQKTAQIRQEIESIKNGDERAARLIEPSLLPGQTQPSRMPYWRIWTKQIGEEDLKKQVWPRVGPALWARYDAKLEEYRRVETDDPSPKLEEKLTASELKTWKADRRREKRQLIEFELSDIATLIREVEGFEVEERLLKLLQRPGVKEVARQNAQQVLQKTGASYSYATFPQGQAPDASWWRENWFLESKWAPLLEKLEEQLLDSKSVPDWQQNHNRASLAVEYYRLNTPQSRTKFRELMELMEQPPYGLSTPVVALRDVETWLMLLERAHWPDVKLKDLWTSTRQNPDSDEARHLAGELLQLTATASRERSAKFMLEMLDEVPAPEWEAHSKTVLAALESPVVAVKRWALKILPQLSDYDRESATSLAGEMLWNENGALVKDAIKFLGLQTGEAANIAWEALQDATSLENQTILETAFRALSNLKKQDNELQLNDAAQEKLKSLCEVAPERFNRFSKKLG